MKQTSAMPSREQWIAAIKIGLYGSSGLVLAALVGMIEVFQIRALITDSIAMGTAIIFVAFFLCGFLALRNKSVSRLGGVLLSAAAGLAIAAVMVVFVLFLNATLPGIRNIFINATPALLEILTFGQGVALGSILLLVSGLIFGGLAGALRYLPSAIARCVVGTLGILLLIGLMQDLFRVTIQNWGPLAPLSRFFFSNNGLTWLGATILVALIFFIQLFWYTRGDQVRARISGLPSGQRQTLRTGSFGFAAIVLLSLPWVLGLFFAEVLDNTGIYIMMGLGLNIVVGFAGLLDLGYVAFYAIGAYTVSILTTISPEILFHPEINFWVALPIAIGCAILAGVILGVPVLKVRGDYLAIVTLGFGEIIRLLALSDALKPWLGGARGIEAVPNPALGPFAFATPQTIYYLILIGCVIAAFIAIRVKDSRLGRAWIAIREDEDVAESMGVDTVRTKLLAFGMGAAFAGVAGAIFASKLGTIYPHSFGFLISINVLALIIIGGMGSIPGVIVGALVLVGLPELLREVQDFRYLIYGVILVLMMLVRPEGLWPEQLRQRELHEAAEEVEESGIAAADEELGREGAAG